MKQWYDVLDLSGPEDAGRRNTYSLLAGTWCEHLLHGQIDVQQDEQLLVFQCACGECLGIPLDVAFEMQLG